MANVQGYESLQRRFHALSGGMATTGLMRQLGIAVVAEAKTRVPRRTGNLGRSIHVAESTPTSVRVVAATNYAADVEFGTKAHIIAPKTAKALAWSTTAAGRRLSGSIRKGVKVGSLGLGSRGGGLGGLSIALVGSAGQSSGAIQFAKVVHHPGTKPEPFLEPAAVAAAKGAGVLGAIIKTWNENG